jgi:coenzyme F420-reducing hydrogenase gamma subunit
MQQLTKIKKARESQRSNQEACATFGNIERMTNNEMKKKKYHHTV